MPTDDEHASVPDLFRLSAHKFAYRAVSRQTVSPRFSWSEVTFPSPVETRSKANNTVHCEYFRPVVRPGQRVPGVVVLHILGGEFALSRVFCRYFARQGTAALFVKMPYYGPRRTPGDSTRMVSHDPKQTVQGVRQAVLDIRRGTAWLASQPEIDSKRLGLFGISLGGVVGALAVEAEPQLQSAALVLAGGDLGQVAWQGVETRWMRKQWKAQGGTIAGLVETLRPVDPLTYAENLRGRRIVMFNARHDEVIPPACTQSLWEAAGRPEIHWMNAGHYSAARFLPACLPYMKRLFADPRQPAGVPQGRPELAFPPSRERFESGATGTE